jgi:4-hydroxybenzoate polyprenyltransferase
MRSGSRSDVDMSEHTGRPDAARAGPLVDYSNLVKLPHTVFALPFALVGATLASYRYPSGRWTSLDPAGVHLRALRGDGVQPHRRPAIDARNPRTRLREIPGGEAVGARGRGGGGGGERLVPQRGDAEPALPGAGAVRARLDLLLLVHQALHPLGAPGARVRAGDRAGGRLPRHRGQWSEPAAALLVLAGAVLCWVGGFDILYSCRTRSSTGSRGCTRFPAALGARGAMPSRGCCTCSRRRLFAAGRGCWAELGRGCTSWASR